MSLYNLRNSEIRNVTIRIMLTLLLIGLLTSVVCIQPVKASGTIYIRPDGSVDPPDAPIQREGDLYTFIDNIYDEIVVERDNIVVDGAGYTLQGTGSGTGIDVTGRSNVTIKNTEIKIFDWGINLYSSSNNSIFGNNITANNGNGIYLDESSNNTISGNNANNNNYHGIFLYSSENNLISNNLVENSGYDGIFLNFADNNLISNNTCEYNGWHDIRHGIELHNSEHNLISNNTCSSNYDRGISLSHSDHNTISCNICENNYYFGIHIDYSSNNTISNNTCEHNGNGLNLDCSSSNTISNNTCENNAYNGIGLFDSSNNAISGNNVADNEYGIYLSDSSNNEIYLNNFINNTNNCYSVGSANIWNSSSLMTYVYNGSIYRNYMGNYWSDYLGDDMDGDGIGDTPYSIDSDTDYYPLTERFENYFQSREDVVYISAWSGPPSGWNPLLPSPAWGNNLQYESLFVYSTRDDVWIPWLAESYTWVDKLTLMIRIRAEARWWDGEPLTAQDVKYTLELGKKYGVSWSYVWDYLEDVGVVDDKRVLLMTSEDKLNYFEFIGLLDDVIVMPKHRWEVLEEELGDKVTQFLDDDPEKIVASGCYKLYQWSEDVWYYKRVEDWWGKEIFGLPGLTYVGHIGYTDNVEALLAFERGEYDGGAFFFPSVWELWEVKGLPIRTYYKDPPYYIGSGVIFLYVNYANYPLNYSAVRRATSYAIPYDDLVSKAYNNYSVRASPSMIIDTIPAYTKWINDTLVEMYGYEYNLTKAAQILDDANITDTDGDGIREMPDGTPLGPYTISVPYGWSDWMMMCDMISADLQSIGINVTADFPDFSVWWDRLSKGMFDFVISWDAGMGFDHPWNTFRFVMDPRLTGPVGEPYPAGNWERYMNEDVIPLIDSAAKDPDPAKLKEIYSQLQELGLTELPAIPLFYGASWYEYSTAYWVGWPCEEDPRWLSPSSWDYPNNIPVYFGLSRASEGIKPMPSWVTDLQIPTTKIFQDLAEAPRARAETTDETGERKDVFDIPETVYISGSGYLPSTTYDLYIVEDTTWSGGMDIPDRVSGTETSVDTDVNGDIPAGTVAWNGPLTPGKYDIVIDVNSNEKYDEDIDALDDEDIEVTAGFLVIPELPLGTILGLVASFVAFGVFKLKKASDTCK